jgi:hypothetical protein
MATKRLKGKGMGMDASMVKGIINKMWGKKNYSSCN